MKRARKKNNNKIRKNERVKVKKQRKIRFLTILKVFLLLIVLMVAGVFIALGFGFISEEELLTPIDPQSGRINALVLGVDDDGFRTDTVIVASLDLETSEVSVLSIPRDTKLYVKNRKMTRKMTEIHAMGSEKGNGTIVGPVGTAEAVSQLTGIPINYYVEFSFDAVRNVIDTLGPVTYDVPDVEGNGRGMNYEDPYQDLYIHLKPGVQELDGDKILQLIRYRKGDSDFARMERQQNVIKSVIDQKLNLSLLLKLPKLFVQMKKDINTNLSAGDVKKYAQYLTKLSGEGIKTYQLPGESQRLKNGWYFVCDIEETKKLVSEVFECDTSQISATVEVYAKNAEIKPIKNKTTQTGTPASKASKKQPKATPKPTQKPDSVENETKKTESSESLKNNSETDEAKQQTKKQEMSEDTGKVKQTDEKEEAQKQRDPEPNVILLD